MKGKLILSWFSPTGAIIILICFFLPWLEVHCSGKKILGSGFSFAQKAAPLWAIPIIAVIIVLVFIWYYKGLSLKWYRIGNIILSLLGIFMMVITIFSIKQKLSGLIIQLITNHKIKYGLMGTLIGFTLILLTSSLIRNKDSKS